MNQAWEHFLAAQAAPPGLAACGVRLPDRSIHCRCLNNWLAPSQIEAALNRLLLAAENFRNHGLEPLILRWHFEHLQIHTLLRKDGACLVLFLDNSDAASASAESVLRDFAGVAVAGSGVALAGSLAGSDRNGP